MHLPAASPFWISDTFLGMAGIIVGMTGVWAAFRAANPRQELAFQVNASVPLLTGHIDRPRDLVEVRVDGRILRNAQLIELRLVNRGRRDIPTEAFDQKRPLCIDVGAPIVKILNAVHSPHGLRHPRLDVLDNVLTVGPDLFKRGQEITVSLLVDGQPRITVPEPPFIDIAVRKRPGDPTVLPPEFTIAVLTILALFGAIGMIVACPTILDESAITIDLGNSALTGDLTPC